MTYKEIYDAMLVKKRELEESLNSSAEYSKEIAFEIRELENMMVSLRNLFRVYNDQPVRWIHGMAHPINESTKYNIQKESNKELLRKFLEV